MTDGNQSAQSEKAFWKKPCSAWAGLRGSIPPWAYCALLQVVVTAPLLPQCETLHGAPAVLHLLRWEAWHVPTLRLKHSLTTPVPYSGGWGGRDSTGLLQQVAAACSGGNTRPESILEKKPRQNTHTHTQNKPNKSTTKQHNKKNTPKKTPIQHLDDWS